MLLLKHASFDTVGGNMKLEQNIRSSKVVISQTASFNHIIIIVDSFVHFFFCINVYLSKKITYIGQLKIITTQYKIKRTWTY